MIDIETGKVGLTGLGCEDYRGKTAGAVDESNQRRQYGDIFEPVPADVPQ